LTLTEQGEKGMINKGTYVEMALTCISFGLMIGYIYGYKRGYGIGKQAGYLRRRRENAAAK
jgi:hypothetical protein